MSPLLEKMFKDAEAGVYDFVAGNLRANKNTIATEVKALIPEGEATLPAVNAIIEKHAGPFVGPLLAGELGAVETELGDEAEKFTGDQLPGIIDNVVNRLEKHAQMLRS